MWPVAVWRCCAYSGPHPAWAVLIVYWRMPGVDERQRMALTQDWATRLLAAMGIELVVHGTPHAGAKLVVANHFLARHHGHRRRGAGAFVSKAEVGRWPLVGSWSDRSRHALPAA